MGKKTAICFLCIAFCGCHIFGPRDLSPFNMITDKNELKDLKGVWKAASPTYDLIKRQKYKIDSIKLLLRNDSTFEAVNLPDCMSDEFGEPVKYHLFSASGTWHVGKDRNEWKMRMNFDRGQLFTGGMIMDFDLYLSGKTLLMSTYVGDPHEVKLLEFERIE